MTDPEFVIIRTFDTPLEKMWDVWTDPELMQKWWGPKGFHTKVSDMDLRPGGIYHYCLQSPEGYEMWGKFVYREVDKPNKLVLINSFSDAQKNVTRHPMVPTWPLELLSTFSFKSLDDNKTELTIQWSPYNANEIETKTFAEGMASMQQGWGGTLDQLAEFLKLETAQ